MEEEINKLKSVLKSLVVSSPTQVDVRTLAKDYRNMMGSKLPVDKFGYKDPITFLRERCTDSFLLQGPSSNPILTLIVSDSIKHIDNFVQKQRPSAMAKVKGKRRSIAESVVKPPEKNLIVKSFLSKSNAQLNRKNISNENNKMSTNLKTSVQNNNFKQDNNIQETNCNYKLEKDKENHTRQNNNCSVSALNNFLKKRTALYSGSETVSDSGNKDDHDSGRQTSSSSSSSKRTHLEDLKKEIKLIIDEHPDGVWCTELLRLYRERFKRELNFLRFGYTSILSLVCEVSGVRTARQQSGDWLLSDATAPAPPARPSRPSRLSHPARRAASPAPPSEDALPGIAFDGDVFPEDCLHFLESVPQERAWEAPGDMVEVVVAEVYSPSHFWLQRLGPRHQAALYRLMDDMNRYYEHGDGRERTLAPGALRVGHYCSSRYDGDWHRSLIVQILDSDTVKVRHVDYGTVETCAAAGLRPLRREWAALPAQAQRARLAGVRPAAGARRWPRAAAMHFLALVRDVPLVANVVAVDPDLDALEVLLIDTAGADDRCLAAEMVRAGHADPRPDTALRKAECYLFPTFHALEDGETPSFAELHALQRDGIAPDFVPAFRRHVPPLLPDDEPLGPSTPAPPSCPSTPPTATAPSLPELPCDPTSSPTRPALAFTRREHRFTPRCDGPAPRGSLTAPACPAPLLPPQPPAAYARLQGGVALSASECEMFMLLSRVDTCAAQRFMLEAIARAAAATCATNSTATAARSLNPEAVEFTASASARDAWRASVSVPPGFE